jgi:four helix bundle protein
MTMIRSFEDMIAWQKARELALSVYRESGTGAFARDPAFRDQLRRTAAAVMSGIAAGFARSRAGEENPTLAAAIRSSAEVRSHLYLARDLGYLSPATHRLLSDRCVEVDRLLHAFARAVAERSRATAASP